MAGKYWEEVKVGDKFLTGGKTITESAITLMVGLAGATEPLFTDAEYAKKTLFKGPIAPGPVTMFMMMGLWMQVGAFSDTAMGLLGFDKVRFTSPVRPGDTIRAEIELIEKKPTDKSDRGFFRWHWVGRNQRDEVVAELESAQLVRRKPA